MLAVFRDDMRTVVRLAGPEFLQRYGIPGGLRIDGEQELNVAEFRASGQAVAARLDLLGVTEEAVRADLETRLSLPHAPGRHGPGVRRRDRQPRRGRLRQRHRRSCRLAEPQEAGTAASDQGARAPVPARCA
jgi:hypothetical protein